VIGRIVTNSGRVQECPHTSAGQHQEISTSCLVTYIEKPVYDVSHSYIYILKLFKKVNKEHKCEMCANIHSFGT